MNTISAMLATLAFVCTGHLHAQSLILPAYSCQTNLYVSTTGNDDTGNGSAGAPFATIGQADSLATPGTCIQLENGTYKEAPTLTVGGNANTATGYVVIRSQNPGKATVESPSNSNNVYSLITVKASYLVFDGLVLSGGTKGSGVSGHGIDGTSDTSQAYRYIQVLNNTIHDMGGGGIVLGYGDWYEIYNNTVYNNSATNEYDTSGISIYEPNYIANDSPNSVHIDVYQNTSYKNFETYSCGQYPGCHTDGEGIIFDDFGHYQGATNYTPYIYKAQIRYNTVYGNGGAGVEVYSTANAPITVTQNTAYDDYLDTNNGGSFRAELYDAFATDVTWTNNIGYTVPGKSGVTAENTAVLDGWSAGGPPPVQKPTWTGNVTYDGVAGQDSANIDTNPTTTWKDANNIVGKNPLFVNPGAGNFNLQSGSPAAGKGAH